jgi:hypothetical protein
MLMNSKVGSLPGYTGVLVIFVWALYAGIGCKKESDYCSDLMLKMRNKNHCALELLLNSEI